MIICEGATEEFFVSKMLAPHFDSWIKKIENLT
jgi:hypothetical protein